MRGDLVAVVQKPGDGAGYRLGDGLEHAVPDLPAPVGPEAGQAGDNRVSAELVEQLEEDLAGVLTDGLPGVGEALNLGGDGLKDSCNR